MKKFTPAFCDNDDMFLFDEPEVKTTDIGVKSWKYFGRLCVAGVALATAFGAQMCSMTQKQTPAPTVPKKETGHHKAEAAIIPASTLYLR